MYYATTGDKFTGREAVAMRFVNRSVPPDQLRAATLELANKLVAKSPAALHYTKEAMRAVRSMTKEQAFDYLSAKSDALRLVDPEGGRQKAMTQFLDEKTYKPGLGEFKRA